MRLSNDILRFAGRDIVWVEVDGERIGFYRSSGKNSGMKGVWLPFDGVGTINFGSPWFDKERYVQIEDLSLKRFGTERLKEVSRLLGQSNLKSGKVATPSQINHFLQSSRSLQWERCINWENIDLEKYLV